METENFQFTIPDGLDISDKGKVEEKPKSSSARDGGSQNLKTNKPPKQPKSTSKAPTSPEEIQQQQIKIDMILRYNSHKKFGPRIEHLTKGLNQEKLKKWSISEIDDLLNRVRASVNSNTTDYVIREGIYKGVGIVENVVTKSSMGERFYLTGYEEAIRKSSEFSDALDQVLIENGNIMSLSPTHRLIYSLVSTAGIVHAKNDAKKMCEERALQLGLTNPGISVEAKRRGPTGFAKKKESSEESQIIEPVSQVVEPQKLATELIEIQPTPDKQSSSTRDERSQSEKLPNSFKPEYANIGIQFK